MPTTRPGKPLRQARKALRRGLGDRHGEDRAHRGAHRFQRERIGRLADQDDALGADGIDGADDGAEIAGIAHPVERHPDVVVRRPDVAQAASGAAAKTPTTTCGLSRRVIAASTFSLTSSTVPPAATVRAATFSTGGIAARRLGEDQRADRPAEVERVDDQLQALGHEGVLLVAELLQRQRLDVLDQRIGEAGDFLDLARRAAGAMFAHAAIQREKSEVESARPADFSRMTSSPDSTVPPMPAKVSRISAWMAKKEARIE